jgi:hypothetical protein
MLGFLFLIAYLTSGAVFVESLFQKELEIHPNNVDKV